jgi:hypothetical protein
MIFVECKPDQILVSSIIPTVLEEKIEHSSGKWAVLGKLTRRKRAPNYENSLGMIDEDPRSHQSAIIRKFQETEGYPEYGIRRKYYRWLNNHVLIICPKLEEWMIEAAREAGVNMDQYDLPTEPNTLHHALTFDTQALDEFQQLVNDIRTRSARIQKLTQCIEELTNRH